MDLSTDRLEPTSRTQERPLSTSAEERKRRPPHRRSSDESMEAEPEDLAEEKDRHQLDDIA
ncbi:MAG: hypothetical protein WBM04_14720 [Candidatus Korobacteraceae bacterium]